MAMPSIIRVSAVFMLVMCLFALIFMEFFGLTKYGHLGSGNVNFRTYGNALLLLVRMTTGEGWVSTQKKEKIKKEKSQGVPRVAR